jgi:DNA mismatch repair protein MSH3
MPVNLVDFIGREIFENQTDLTNKGSLISILDRTQTQFGSRYLRQWVGKPLIDKVYAFSHLPIRILIQLLCSILQERFDAVEEIHQGQSANLVKLQTLLKGLPDLVRGLCRIQYGKVCNCTSLSITHL